MVLEMTLIMNKNNLKIYLTQQMCFTFNNYTV